MKHKKNNRIGILTIHDTTNFGSLLQSYSTYKVLNDKGYNCEFIDYHCESITKREKQKSIFESDDFKDIFRYFVYGPRNKKKYKTMSQFVHSETQLSPRFDIENIKDANKRYDTFLVGSDIVWGLSITNDDFTYFLDFVEGDKKKFAFSSSMGEKWDDHYDKIKGYLSRFDKIAVREEEAQGWIKDICDLDVEVVCDPTMLISKNEWHKLALESKLYPKLVEEKYILIYFAIGDIFENAKQLADEFGYKIYHVNYRNQVTGTKAIRPYHPSDWLALIENASIVLTASYHGMLYSLYFNKEVYYYNRGWKSRMNSLAEYLGITHREATKKNLKEEMPIDYDLVNKLLADKVKYSNEVLDTYEF